jgi:hypothetical protein
VPAGVVLGPGLNLLSGEPPPDEGVPSAAPETGENAGVADIRFERDEFVAERPEVGPTVAPAVHHAGVLAGGDISTVDVRLARGEIDANRKEAIPTVAPAAHQSGALAQLDVSAAEFRFARGEIDKDHREVIPMVTPAVRHVEASDDARISPSEALTDGRVSPSEPFTPDPFPKVDAAKTSALGLTNRVKEAKPDKEDFGVRIGVVEITVVPAAQRIDGSAPAGAASSRLSLARGIARPYGLRQE